MKEREETVKKSEENPDDAYPSVWEGYDSEAIYPEFDWGLDPEQEATLAIDTALIFTFRYGPDEKEIAGLWLGKKVLVRLLPKRYRWRLSELAPDVKALMATIEKP